MRKLIYYVSTTLDGFIANEDGSFEVFSWDDNFMADLLAEFPETIPAHLKEQSSLQDQNKVFDTVLMGRKTYEVALQKGITNPYPTLDQYVFSHKMDNSQDENITLVSEDAIKMVQSLKNKQGKAIWLCGGADLAGQMLEKNLIDRLIVKLNPVVFGSGISLFSGGVQPKDLKLTESKAYKSSHIMLYYLVGRS